MIPDYTPGSSLVRVQVGNRIYDARRVNNCHCCNHPARMQIEKMVAEGHPYPDIAKQFSEVEYVVGDDVRVLPKIGWMSIRSHYTNGHMPVEMRAVREIAEARLQELGKHVEELQERYVDAYITARTVMTIGLDKIINGEMTPTVRETLAAAKILEDFKLNEREGGPATDEAWQEAMHVYFTVAQQLMPEEMWETFVRRLTVNPQLQALAARLEQGESDDVRDEKYMDAEVVTGKGSAE